MKVKLPIFNILYKEGDINLLVDTSAEGVKIPDYLYGKLTNFIVGQNLSASLEADERGITTPMRFGETRFVCHFPWSSIRAMVARKAVVNFPVEKEDDSDDKTKKGHPSLKLIK